MPQYTTLIQATTNATINIEDALLELLAAAASAIRIKRITASLNSASSDARLTVNVRRTSTAGAGGVAIAAAAFVKRDSQMRATSVTGVAKTGATAFSVGTVTDTPHQDNFNGRGTFLWVPRNYMEEMIVIGGQRLVIGVQSSIASQVMNIAVEFED